MSKTEINKRLMEIRVQIEDAVGKTISKVEEGLRGDTILIVYTDGNFSVLIADSYGDEEARIRDGAMDPEEIFDIAPELLLPEELNDIERIKAVIQAHREEHERKWRLAEYEKLKAEFEKS